MTAKVRAALVTFTVLILMVGALAWASSSLSQAVAATKPPVRKLAPAKKPAAPPVRTINRIVPIFSAGQGTRVGLAQITGPANYCSAAAVVGQIETTYQDVVRIRIFVPVKTEGGFDRVPQVNVSAYGDLRL